MTVWEAAVASGVIGEDVRKANYDSNIVCTLFLEEVTKNIGSRDDYCAHYQDHVRDLLVHLMVDSEDLGIETSDIL